MLSLLWRPWEEQMAGMESQSKLCPTQLNHHCWTGWTQKQKGWPMQMVISGYKKGAEIQYQWQKRKYPFEHCLNQDCSFRHTGWACCQKTIKGDCWPGVSLCLMGGRTNQFNRSVFHPTWDKQMFLTPGPTVRRLMKGHVDPIANQYVPNMQCLLQLLMKKQAGWFIVLMLEEAKHCCCTIKPWTGGNLTEQNPRRINSSNRPK